MKILLILIKQTEFKFDKKKIEICKAEPVDFVQISFWGYISHHAGHLSWLLILKMIWNASELSFYSSGMSDSTMKNEGLRLTKILVAFENVSFYPFLI